MKSRTWAAAGAAVVLMVGVTVWAEDLTNRSPRPVLRIGGFQGTDGEWVQITVDIPGKQLQKLIVKPLPGGRIVIGEDGTEKSKVTVNKVMVVLQDEGGPETK